MFNEQKTAQIAAWFLDQDGGSMPHLKLMKLMYLAERESMGRHGYTMTGDRFVSMPHGPVLSLTLNHMDDALESAPDGWDSWVSDKANFVVGLVREVSRDALDELSDADLDVLTSVWKKFGWMTKYQIRDYTHDPRNCPEWRDPEGSSYPIAYETVFEALGHEKAIAEAMAKELKAQNQLARVLAN